MIGLDTNVLVRYLAQDDKAQARVATKLIDALTPEKPGYISTAVLLETVWVLARAYKTPRDQIGDTLENILRARELVVENADIAYLALDTYRTAKADFADALIVQSARRAGCREIVTFDKAARASGMRVLNA